jgi:hypothetical protein
MDWSMPTELFFWLVKRVVLLFKLIIILLKLLLWRATIDNVVMLKYGVCRAATGVGFACSCLRGRQ